MKPNRDLAYINAHVEIKAGQEAKKIGNIGKARVCARRGCGIAIDHWLKYHPEKNWGESAISVLTQLQKDQTIPLNIREAAEKLTKKVNQNFKEEVEEDPLKDGETIIEYFLDRNTLKEM
jgi:hypothetical protein